MAPHSEERLTRHENQYVTKANESAIMSTKFNLDCDIYKETLLSAAYMTLKGLFLYRYFISTTTRLLSFNYILAPFDCPLTLISCKFVSYKLRYLEL